MPQLLLFVFATHLPFFAWRWRRTGEARYAATSVTFALLTLVYGLGILAPEARCGGVRLVPPLRAAALVSAALSLGLLARHLLLRARSRRRAP
jgi:hypothetical protein